MIASLRTWHRRWWIVLAVALPLLVVMALLAREKVPTMRELPVATESSP